MVYDKHFQLIYHCSFFATLPVQWELLEVERNDIGMRLEKNFELFHNLVQKNMKVSTHKRPITGFYSNVA